MKKIQPYIKDIMHGFRDAGFIVSQLKIVGEKAMFYIEDNIRIGIVLDNGIYSILDMQRIYKGGLISDLHKDINRIAAEIFLQQ